MPGSCHWPSQRPKLAYLQQCPWSAAPAGSEFDVHAVVRHLQLNLRASLQHLSPKMSQYQTFCAETMAVGDQLGIAEVDFQVRLKVSTLAQKEIGILAETNKL